MLKWNVKPHEYRALSRLDRILMTAFSEAQDIIGAISDYENRPKK